MARKRRIVYTAGVWDLLHTGHINILKRSRELGDSLIVGVVTDLGAAQYKPKPPVYSEHARLEIIQSLAMVHAAFLQPGTDPSSVLRALAAVGATPSIMTHGDDWTELKQGNETLSDLRIELHLIPYTPGISTTKVRTLIDQ